MTDVHYFPDGSYVLHKLSCSLGNGKPLSAWYDCNGHLKDSERLTNANVMRSVVRGGKVWKHAARVGKLYKQQENTQ